MFLSVVNGTYYDFGGESIGSSLADEVWNEISKKILSNASIKNVSYLEVPSEANLSLVSDAIARCKTEIFIYDDYYVKGVKVELDADDSVNEGIYYFTPDSYQIEMPEKIEDRVSINFTLN